MANAILADTVLPQAEEFAVDDLLDEFTIDRTD